MYSPGKALVVYEIRRHVWTDVNGCAHGSRAGEAYLADGTVTGDDALQKRSASVSLHLERTEAYLQGLRRRCSSHCGGVGVRVSDGDEGCSRWEDAEVAAEERKLDGCTEGLRPSCGRRAVAVSDRSLIGAGW